MLFQSDSERAFAQAVSKLSYANPFLPERIRYEREALGDELTASDSVWHGDGIRQDHPNLIKLQLRAETLVDSLRERLKREKPAKSEFRLYEDLVLYYLYNRYEGRFYDYIVARPAESRPLPFYGSFVHDYRNYLGAGDGLPQATHAPDHVFALFYQLRRAFHQIFGSIIGASMPVARLRASIWQSIFTHDLRRYQRALYRQMGDIASLVTGPSGTGKELVAAALGYARYIPFDSGKKTFACAYHAGFFPLNLSALSPTLIESELFGHRRGAFTGAVGDRQGWLEICPALGTVFLDEIGEVETAIQVKLLRVLQERVFQRLGDAADRRFQGKIVAATNRDLAAEMEGGRFREDLYYRLCADQIATPPLVEQLRDNPADLTHFLAFIARKVAGEQEAEALATEVGTWIARHLPKDYAWPGNVRELEQCVRNIMIHGEYRPRTAAPPGNHVLATHLRDCGLSADSLLRLYCKEVYRETGSYQETARRLSLDRRTVKAKLD